MSPLGGKSQSARAGAAGGSNGPNPDTDAILINRAKRAVVKPRRLGACIITGADKIRSGFGNGDCLMLDFKNLVFAVSDATERFPAASRSLLTRLTASLADGGAPESKAGWLDLINSVYAGQSYHHRATLSCVAVDRKKGTTTAYVTHGGDSIVLLINLKTKQIDYRTSADMCFAGRAKKLLCVDEAPIGNGEYGFVIASDGIADPARLAGQTLEKISGAALSRFPLHEIPEGLTNYLDELAGPVEYDDIGVIAFSPTELEYEDQPTILIGGATPAEEAAFQEMVSARAIEDNWVALRDLTPEAINRKGTIRI